jgi:hypothetical protein
MKAYKESRDMVRIILTSALDGGKYLPSGLDRFYPGKIAEVAMKWEPGWTADPVRKFWRREQSPAFTEFEPQIVQPVA